MLNDSHDGTRTHTREDTNIRKVVFVSSKTKEGIPELINELVLGAKKHSFLKQVIPGSYFDLFQILQNMRKEGTSYCYSQARRLAPEFRTLHLAWSLTHSRSWQAPKHIRARSRIWGHRRTCC